MGFLVTQAGLTLSFVLLLLAEEEWGPLSTADQGARDALHVFALSHPLFVSAMRDFSDLGSSLACQIGTVAVTLVLLVRRRWRLAAFTVV